MDFKALLTLCLLLPVMVYCQDQRYFLPREIKEAYEKGSRSPDGKPGEKYFQNRANYNMDIIFQPLTKKVEGQAEIIYFNNSPVNLSYIVFRLYQNIFIRGGIRGRKVDPADLHDGMIIKNVVIEGQNYSPESCILKNNTNIVFPLNLGAGKKAKIYIEWEFYMPSKTGNRFGCYNSGSCFMGYWYPQVSVYDDISGWDFSEYTGVAEFYNNYGDFNVNITVPKNYIVWAGGELQNPEKILSEEILKRYQHAKTTDEIVHIVTKKDLKKKIDITNKKNNTWKYSASNVSDFAFAISNNYVWDATTITIKDKSEYKKILVETAYDPSSGNFHKAAEIAAWSVQDFSTDLPGVPYPYSKLTVFQGKDGMEYPMIINIGDSGFKELLFVITHEIAHTYFPFLVGTNQKRYGWMDEGLITVLGQEQHLKKETTQNFQKLYLQHYPKIAGKQEDIPPIVNSGYLSDEIFQIHEYMRPSLAFWILRDILGQKTFRECLHGFIEIWKGKSPTPWDMFFTFENIAGLNLDWFFKPWFCEFAYPDLEITEIISKDGTNEIKIKNSGGMPFPSRLKITLQNGKEVYSPLPANIWKDTSEYIFIYDKADIITSAEIITEGFPDTNIENNLMLNKTIE